MSTRLWKKGYGCTLLAEREIGIVTVEDSKEVPPTKKQTHHMIQDSTPGYISKENENASLKRYMHSHIHNSIIYNSQYVEATQVFTNRRMNIEDVLYTSKGILFGHQKGHFVICNMMTWNVLCLMKLGRQTLYVITCI